MKSDFGKIKKRINSNEFGNSTRDNYLQYQLDNEVAYGMSSTQEGSVVNINLLSKTGKIMGQMSFDSDPNNLQGQINNINQRLDEEFGVRLHANKIGTTVILNLLNKEGEILSEVSFEVGEGQGGDSIVSVVYSEEDMLDNLAPENEGKVFIYNGVTSKYTKGESYLLEDKLLPLYEEYDLEDPRLVGGTYVNTSDSILIDGKTLDEYINDYCEETTEWDSETEDSKLNYLVKSKVRSMIGGEEEDFCSVGIARFSHEDVESGEIIWYNSLVLTLNALFYYPGTLFYTTVDNFYYQGAVIPNKGWNVVTTDLDPISYELIFNIKHLDSNQGIVELEKINLMACTLAEKIEHINEDFDEKMNGVLLGCKYMSKELSELVLENN